ncbi:Gfo/Idh/MocA family protein [Rhodopirellula sp. SWK7]|uniref:Gfo/Idh/MocA family protein n=1 Tax=Rhodopirellula sp. SWK7 TaxID=595460 RepID=UPI0002BE1142|nr:Gfo/Idh/MocA family oxidoreductase [Rhodopirellula sp. SWK7]EMI44078.1 NADH-dependent dehydrogenase [Rhodopirellula sp. SWK7]
MMTPDQHAMPTNASRRSFLKTTSAMVGAGAIPSIWTSRNTSAAAGTNKPTIAAIGVGGSRGRYNQGRAIANAAAKLGQMIAVCDVDALHNDEFNAAYDGKLKTYQDYRKLFENEKPDVVTIGTPDHWHVPIALHALDHGCDVYCEKPLTLTIAEGELIRKAVEKSGRVFQVGTMQRSWNLFMHAVAIVQSGRLGDNVVAHCGIDPAPVGGPFEATPVPEGLDWDLWLGPTVKKDYSMERRRFFRWYLEYSGGKMTDWGAHHVDIAQWALGLDHTHIQTVSGTGALTPIVPDQFNWNKFFDGEADLPNAYNSATQFNIELTFEGGKKITVNDKYESGDTSFGNGILFEGDKGRIFVNRSKLQGSAVKEIFGDNLEKKRLANGKRVDNFQECFARVDDATRTEFEEAFTKLNKGKRVTSHMENFFTCIEDRSEPMSDVSSHINSMNSLHMCNISLMLGRALEWNGAARNFGSDDQANALMTRKRREGFELDV